MGTRPKSISLRFLKMGGTPPALEFPRDTDWKEMHRLHFRPTGWASLANSWQLQALTAECGWSFFSTSVGKRPAPGLALADSHPLGEPKLCFEISHYWLSSDGSLTSNISPKELKTSIGMKVLTLCGNCKMDVLWGEKEKFSLKVGAVPTVSFSTSERSRLSALSPKKP